MFTFLTEEGSIVEIQLNVRHVYCKFYKTFNAIFQVGKYEVYLKYCYDEKNT